MGRSFTVLVCLLLLVSTLVAQNKFTVSGYVKDGVGGTGLIGAGVQVKESGNGVYTNQDGFYSLQVRGGAVGLKFTYLGYLPLDTVLNVTADMQFNISLKPQAKEIGEVVIKSQRPDENVQSSEMGKETISMEKLATLPAIFGETDILKTIQLLPGVQSGGQGSTGFIVRGGGPDQNLIQMDDATVYNSSHLFGFFSVFNSDAINSATLYKDIPANFGGRVSSVLDITTKDGDDEQFHVSGGLGLIDSRLTLQGPIKKKKSSFIISARRTYLDVLLKPVINNSPTLAGTDYYFYDLNAKITYNISDKDRLFLSGYFGRDVFTYDSPEFDVHIPWGNGTVTLRWNHIFSSKVFVNTSLIFSNYNFKFDASQSNFNIGLYSGITDFNLKQDYVYYFNSRNEIKYGFNAIYHIFTPSTLSGSSGSVQFQPNDDFRKYGDEGALYISDKYTISDKFELNAGLRYSLFAQVGPYTQYRYNSAGSVTDSTVYKSGQIVKAYGALEPRALLRYKASKTSSIKVSFTIADQFIHLVSENGTTLPTDIWVPSTSLVKPQVAYQYSAGYFRNFHNNMFETSVEVYYKYLLNQIEFKEGYIPMANQDIQNSFVFGTGDSKGMEVYINKKEGKLTGWISYTLSYTNRYFPDLNNGLAFPYRYDTRDILDIVLDYKLNDHWTFGSVFVYNTGIAYTLPEGKYFIEGNVVTEYGALNSNRLPPYDRLDVSATYTRKHHVRYESSWTFSIYNAYNRFNPYFIYDNVSGIFLQSPTVTVQAKAVSLFPIIPSITWNFKF